MKFFDEQQEELTILVEEVVKKRDRIIPIIGDNCFVGILENSTITEHIVTLQEWLIETMLEDDIDADTKKKMAIEGYWGNDMFYKVYEKIYKRHRDDFTKNVFINSCRVHLVKQEFRKRRNARIKKPETSTASDIC